MIISKLSMTTVVVNSPVYRSKLNHTIQITVGHYCYTFGVIDIVSRNEVVLVMCGHEVTIK